MRDDGAWGFSLSAAARNIFFFVRFKEKDGGDGESLAAITKNLYSQGLMSAVNFLIKKQKHVLFSVTAYC
jgi:hypothetical protein